MIKIKETIVTSAKQFRSCFDLDVVMPMIGKVARDVTLFTDEHDIAVQQLLERVLDKGITDLTLCVEEGQQIIRCEGMNEVILFFGGCGDVREPSSDTEWKILLLGELAHQKISFTDQKSNVAQNRNQKGIPEVIILHTDQQLELTLFKPVAELDESIRTIKIVNGSELVGAATIVVKTLDGKMIDMVRLGNKECLYANFLGNNVVELLPRLMSSFDHCNFLVCENQEATTLGRYVFATGDSYIYRNCTDIAQFCPDEEQGFVGVANGHLLPFTSLLNPIDDCDFQLENDEYFVKAVINGRMLLALTNKGRTFSNYDKSELTNLHDIVSIGVGTDHSMYALTSRAELLLSNDEWSVPTSNVYSVCQLGQSSFAVRTRDGLTFSSGKTSTSIGKQVKATSGLEFAIDPLNRSLMCKGTDLPSLQDGIDDIILYEKSGNKKQVVTYSHSQIKCFNIK